MAGLATRLVLDERGMIGQAGGKVQAAKALSAAVRKERTSGALIKAAGVEDGGACAKIRQARRGGEVQACGWGVGEAGGSLGPDAG